MPLLLRIIRSFFVVGCTCFLMFGLIELGEWSEASAEPEVLTLEQWAAADGTKNIYLKISEFTFSERYITLKNSRDNFTKVYVPLMLPNKHWPDRRLLISRTSYPSDPDSWQDVYDLTEIEGMLYRITDSEEQQKLKRQVRQISGRSGTDQMFVLALNSKTPSPYFFVPLIAFCTIVGSICAYFELPIWWKEISAKIEKQAEQHRQDKEAKQQAEMEAKETPDI